MKRKLSHIIFAAAALLAAVSCSKEEAPVIPLHLTVSTYEVSFDAAGGNQQIDYCYSGDWTEAAEECDWLDTKLFISQEDGSMKTLSITAEENTTGKARETEIILSVMREGDQPGSIIERLDRVVTVRQAGE